MCAPAAAPAPAPAIEDLLQDDEHEQMDGARAVRSETADAAKRFAEFDMDGNERLDFEEFLSMQPQPASPL